jgi:orotidine-5'-phosphate decarboxylase
VFILKYTLNEKERRARSMVCLPLDGLTAQDARARVEELSDLVGLFKINDLFTALGPEAIELIREHGGECFLDLKFHDIPNTVENYAHRAASHGVYMFNVHATGGLDMMKAAVKGVDKAIADAKNEGHDLRRPKVYAVTVLTSLDTVRFLHTLQPLLPWGIKEEEYEKYYPVGALKKKKERTPDEQKLVDGWAELIQYDTSGVIISGQVLHLAKLAHKAGLNGIVCSAAELAYVKPQMPEGFLYTTPGIESPSGKVGADQMRTFTPANAVKAGSNILVVGRAITDYKTADERRAAAYAVIQDIANVLE